MLNDLPIGFKRISTILSKKKEGSILIKQTIKEGRKKKRTKEVGRRNTIADNEQFPTAARCIALASVSHAPWDSRCPSEEDRSQAALVERGTVSESGAVAMGTNRGTATAHQVDEREEEKQS